MFSTDMRFKTGLSVRNTLALAIFFTLAPYCFAALSAPSPEFFCKYSVRDVAFVNMEDSTWRLLIQKPLGIEQSQIDQWNKQVDESLDRVNVSIQWVENESDWFRGTGQATAGKLNVALVDADDNVFRPAPLAVEKINESIDRLVSSHKREEILAKNVASLCVFVLVESGDRQKDEAALSLVMDSIEETNAQLWSLEKPTQEGPKLVTVTVADRKAESLLIKMLGIESFEEPTVALVYGQARRMGDLLKGKTLLKKNLVWMAGVCGRDCECSLDRNWLYGSQFLHRWDKAKERAVEDVLGFDPHSALVVSEVAQILQKTAKNKGSEVPDMNDGLSGLVIHDLGSLTETETDADRNSNQNVLDKNTQDQKTVQSGGDQAETTQNDGATNAEVESVQPEENDNQSNSQQQKSTENRSQLKGIDGSDDAGSSERQSNTIPWTLLITVAVLSCVIVVWKLTGK